MNTYPKLLILSGMHGDEFEVIGCVKDYLANHTVADHMFIPEISPSAVAAQTRRNKFGHDVNRQFFDPPEDEEVKAIMDQLLPYHFDLTMNFHEDPDLAQTFYLYDSGQLSEDSLLLLRSTIIELGVGLHTGIDDPLDADLDLQVDKGYVSTPFETLPQNAGFSWVWMHNHGITKRAVDIEIPGRAPIELKQKLVEAIFDTMHIFGT